jgi:secreted trypsin-like serine protease
VVGVTSFGRFCGFKNSPAIYTKVAHYLPWIESIVWPQQRPQSNQLGGGWQWPAERIRVPDEKRGGGANQGSMVQSVSSLL